jgi:anti-sigma regulatory factor (Ser/Thr protein kinase)
MIDIVCDAASSQLRVDVRDDRYRKLPDGSPKRPSMMAVEGEGLGIFLIQALMDNLEYNVDTNYGAQLVMTKRVGA